MCEHPQRIPYKSPPGLLKRGHGAFKSKCIECGTLTTEEPNKP